MDLSDIVSITGMPGLYKINGQRNNGVIVQNLVDGSNKFISARMHSISPLENITIYVMDADGNRELSKILAAMKKASDKTPVIKPQSTKDELSAYFKTIVPDYDEEQVYVSDIKKIVKWYHILDNEGFFEKTSKESSEEEE